MKISKKIERYNDDFYLNYTGNSSKYGVITDSFNEISSSNWSMSFFVVSNNVFINQTVIDSRNGTLDTEGWAIESRFDGVYFVTGKNASQSDYKIMDALKEGVFECVHIVFSSNQITTYRNSQKLNQLNVTTLVNSGITNARLGLGYGGLNPFFGGVRDFNIYDVSINDQDVLYTYKKGVIPSPTHINIKHCYPLNDRPYENLGNYYLKDVAQNYNPSATNSDVELIGWSDAELGVSSDGFQTQNTYKDFEGKYKYNPNSLVFFNNQTISNLDMTSVDISNDWCFNFRINPYKRPYGTNSTRYLLASGTSNVDFFAIRLITSGTFQQSIESDFAYSSGGSNTFISLYDYEDKDLATNEISKKDIICTLQRVGTSLNIYVNGDFIKSEVLPVSVFSTLSNNVAIFNRNNGGSKVDSVGISHISLCSNLTEQEIKEIHNGNFDLLNNPSFEYYPSTSVNKVIKDLSGNGFDFSYTGGDDAIDTSSEIAIPYYYSTGLNMLPSQSLTFNGLTIGDKLVVNYDELGVTKQDVIDVNTVNYTYSNVNNIKLRLATVLKDGFYANDKVYKTIFNNGVLRSGILSSYSEVVNDETNLKNPIDNLGVLEFPDLSVNNRVNVANGWADLTDLENSID